MNYEELGYAELEKADESEEEPQHDMCCKCGRWWDKGPVCDCGCSHRACYECESEEEPQEEVRCICPKCEGEGWCFVSKERANELKAQELMEECCPFGDACVYK